MNGNPRVSVGIPVYNGEKFIRKSIESILNQSFGDLEIVISDNASTDRTQEICLDYSERNRQVRYHRNPDNYGLPFNYQKAFDLSVGDYFKWQSADDSCEACYLERCVEVLDRNPDVVLAYSKTTFINRDDRELLKTDPGMHLTMEEPCERLRRVIYHGGHWANADALSGLIRKDALLKTRFMPDYQGGDKRLLAELSLLGKFCEIPEHLNARRQHLDASSHNTANVKWMMDFFKGKKRTKYLPTLSLFLDYLLLICHSDMRITEKVSLVLSIAKSLRWSLPYVIKEFRRAFSGILG